MEKTAFEEFGEKLAEQSRRKFGPPIPEAEREKIRVVLERIAMAAASENGDPILNDISVISQRTMNLAPRTIAELHAAGPVAVDRSGGRYFVYVRTDGTGQIDIRWTSGIEKTVKFSVPERYLVCSGKGGASKEENKPRSRGLPSASEFLSRHAFLFTLLGVTLVIDFYQALTNNIGGGISAIGSVAAIGYFLGSAYVLRFCLIRKAAGWATALLISMVLYFGWCCLCVLAASERVPVSLLLAACTISAFRILRYNESNA